MTCEKVVTFLFFGFAAYICDTFEKRTKLLKLKSCYKQWIGLGLLMLMFVKAWVIPLIYVDYEVRKNYIAKTLCVNRNKPILKCNGKCYLAKRIAEAEKQQERQAEQDYLSSLIYQVMDSDSKFSFKCEPTSFQESVIKSYFFKSALLGTTLPDKIFRPPLA